MLDINTIYNEDCIKDKGMCLIDDCSVDMILCDLPYGTTKNKWDVIISPEEMWKQYKRVLKSNGAIVLTAAQPFTTMLINSNPKMFKYDLIWYKPLGTGFLNSKKMPMRNHEHILVFYDKLPTYNPQMGVGVRKKGMRKNDRNGECYNDFNQNRIEPFDDNGTRYPQSVIEITNGDRTIENEHPTQKPIDLFRYLIKTYSNEGDLVLDNCMGSGTTAKACILEKRNYIGFETDEKYFDIAIKGIEKITRTPQLF